MYYHGGAIFTLFPINQKDDPKGRPKGKTARRAKPAAGQKLKGNKIMVAKLDDTVFTTSEEVKKELTKKYAQKYGDAIFGIIRAFNEIMEKNDRLALQWVFEALHIVKCDALKYFGIDVNEIMNRKIN